MGTDGCEARKQLLPDTAEKEKRVKSSQLTLDVQSWIDRSYWYYKFCLLGPLLIKWKWMLTSKNASQWSELYEMRKETSGLQECRLPGVKKGNTCPEYRYCAAFIVRMNSEWFVPSFGVKVDITLDVDGDLVNKTLELSPKTTRTPSESIPLEELELLRIQFQGPNQEEKQRKPLLSTTTEKERWGQFPRRKVPIGIADSPLNANIAEVKQTDSEDDNPGMFGSTVALVVIAILLLISLVACLIAMTINKKRRSRTARTNLDHDSPPTAYFTPRDLSTPSELLSTSLSKLDELTTAQRASTIFRAQLKELQLKYQIVASTSDKKIPNTAEQVLVYQSQSDSPIKFQEDDQDKEMSSSKGKELHASSSMISMTNERSSSSTPDDRLIDNGAWSGRHERSRSSQRNNGVTTLERSKSS